MILGYWRLHLSEIICRLNDRMLSEHYFIRIPIRRYRMLSEHCIIGLGLCHGRVLSEHCVIGLGLCHGRVLSEIFIVRSASYPDRPAL